MSLKIKILSFMLAIFACISLTACGGKTDDPEDDTPGDDFSGSISGDKNEEKPDDEEPKDEGDPDKVITITTPEQLREMKRKGTYILGADIDIGDTSWTPVGTYGAPFEGTFDGAGHKITGLKINAAKEDSGISLSYKYAYYGLFGVTNGAKIKDVVFDNVEISATSSELYYCIYAGTVAGFTIDTEITNCTFSGSINAVSSNSIALAGSVTGMSKGTKISNCISFADVKTDNSPVRAISGGIVGHARPGTEIDNCSTNANITAISTKGVAYAGGIAGYCHSVKMTACISDSEIYAEVTLSSPETGGKGSAHAAGITAVSIADNEKEPSTFTKCYTKNNKIAAYSVENATYAAGLVTDTDYSKFTDCFSYAVLESESVNEASYAAGLFGTLSKACVIENSFFAGSIKIDSNDETVGTICVSNLEKEDAEKVFLSAFYKSDTVFNINGIETTKGQNKDILSQGESRQPNVFSNLSMLCETLGWSIDEWEMINGMISLK